MKAYLLTTASIFALIVVMHIWRMIAESSSLAKDPWFLLITLVAASLCGWGFTLLRSQPSRT